MSTPPRASSPKTSTDTHGAAADPEQIKDPDQIKQEIDCTREQLGDTVQALADKADIPARVKDTAREAADQVQATAGQLGEQARHTAHTMQAKADDLAAWTRSMTDRAVAALPPAAAQRAEHVRTLVRQHPVAAAAATVIGLWALRRLLRRDR
jgi:ABC-type transporter Mla subunit MlaD